MKLYTYLALCFGIVTRDNLTVQAFAA